MGNTHQPRKGVVPLQELAQHLHTADPGPDSGDPAEKEAQVADDPINDDPTFDPSNQDVAGEADEADTGAPMPPADTPDTDDADSVGVRKIGPANQSHYKHQAERLMAAGLAESIDDAMNKVRGLLVDEQLLTQEGADEIKPEDRAPTKLVITINRLVETAGPATTDDDEPSPEPAGEDDAAEVKSKDAAEAEPEGEANVESLEHMLASINGELRVRVTRARAILEEEAVLPALRVPRLQRSDTEQEHARRFNRSRSKVHEWIVRSAHKLGQRSSMSEEQVNELLSKKEHGTEWSQRVTTRLIGGHKGVNNEPVDRLIKFIHLWGNFISEELRADLPDAELEVEAADEMGEASGDINDGAEPELANLEGSKFWSDLSGPQREVAYQLKLIRALQQGGASNAELQTARERLSSQISFACQHHQVKGELGPQVESAQNWMVQQLANEDDIAKIVAESTLWKRVPSQDGGGAVRQPNRQPEGKQLPPIDLSKVKGGSQPPQPLTDEELLDAVSDDDFMALCQEILADTESEGGIRPYLDSPGVQARAEALYLSRMRELSQAAS